MPAMTDGIGRPCLTVFVPNTPTPFTGFTITVPESEVIDVPISIDGAYVDERYINALQLKLLAGRGIGAPIFLRDRPAQQWSDSQVVKRVGRYRCSEGTGTPAIRHGHFSNCAQR